MLEALLLRFRTARYSCKLAEQPPEGWNHSSVAAVPAKLQWEVVQVPSCLSLAVGRLQEACAPQLKSYKQAQLEEARRQLLQVTANVLQRHAGNAGKACAVIQKVQLLVRGTSGKDADHTVAGSSCANSSGPTARLLNVAYTLQRTDVPALLELLCAVSGAQPTGNKSPQHTEDVVSIGAVTPGLLRMLVLGPWCTQPAQVFRNSQIVQQLCAYFGSECEDLLEAVHGQEVCCGAFGSNKHGHCADMPFPGPDGWTAAYAEAWLAAVAEKPQGQQIKVRSMLQAMKQFTAMAAWAKQTAAGNAEKAVAVAVVLSKERDAKRHAHVLSRLQALLGQSMP